MKIFWLALVLVGCSQSATPNKSAVATAEIPIHNPVHEPERLAEKPVTRIHLPVSIDEVKARLSLNQTSGHPLQGGVVWKLGGAISSVEVGGDDGTHLNRILLIASAGEKLDSTFLALDYAKIFAKEPNITLVKWLESGATLPASMQMDGMRFELSLINSTHVLEITPAELTH